MAVHHPLSNFRYKTFKSLNWQNFLAAFSLQERGAKKKLPKRNAEIGISPSADGEKGVAPSPHKLLKKFDQNFYPIVKLVHFLSRAAKCHGGSRGEINL